MLSFFAKYSWKLAFLLYLLGSFLLLHKDCIRMQNFKVIANTGLDTLYLKTDFKIPEIIQNWLEWKTFCFFPRHFCDMWSITFLHSGLITTTPAAITSRQAAEVAEASFAGIHIIVSPANKNFKSDRVVFDGFQCFFYSFNLLFKNIPCKSRYRLIHSCLFLPSL